MADQTPDVPPAIPQEVFRHYYPSTEPLPDYERERLQREADLGPQPYVILPSQSTYPDTMQAGAPGMPATEVNWDADTKLVETAAGIAFARAVSKGTGDKQVIVGGAKFRGVTYWDRTLVATCAAVDVYPQYFNAGICTRGDLWVDVKDAVTPDDPVCYDPVTGRLGKTGTSIIGAQWMRSQSQIGGVTIVRLNGPQPLGVTVP